MDEQVRELIGVAKKIQDAAARANMQVEARACIIAASNLVLADSLAAKTKAKSKE